HERLDQHPQVGSDGGTQQGRVNRSAGGDSQVRPQPLQRPCGDRRGEPRPGPHHSPLYCDRELRPATPPGAPHPSVDRLDRPGTAAHQTSPGPGTGTCRCPCANRCTTVTALTTASTAIATGSAYGTPRPANNRPR